MRNFLYSHLGIVLVLSCFALGCGDDDGGGDPDTGPGDTDAGPMEVDAGPGDVDAGPGDVDAGPGDVDAGPGDTDAGPGDTDAGPMDMDAGPAPVDAGPMGGAMVVINEVVPDPVVGEDWIELHNAGTADADVSGWVITDNDPTHLFMIPAGTTIAAGGYLTFDSGAAGSFTYGLGRGGDSVILYDASMTMVDMTMWTEPDADSPNSWGRFPNGTGAFGTRAVVTKGLPNL